MKTVKLSSTLFIPSWKRTWKRLAGRWRADLKKQGSLSTGKSSEWQGTDYETYRLGKKEWLRYGAEGVLYAALLNFVFYRSSLLFFLSLPVGLCYPLLLKEELKKKRREELTLQFKDAILFLASCLNAGYSVENAFSEALKETDRLYGKESMISGEIRLLLHKIRLNRTVGDALLNFAERSGIRDVRSFAEVFLAARESGGELMKIIARTAEIISEKIRIREDILTATASRRLEQKIMSAIPVLMVVYLELTSPGYFDILYTTGIGRILMTVCLLVYLASLQMAKKFLEIPV